MHHEKLGYAIRTKYGPFWHYGIVVENRKVITSSIFSGKVVEIPYDDFSIDGIIEIDVIQSIIPNEMVILLAKSMLGRPYDLLNFNCEHLVRLSQGHGARSDQAIAAMLFLLVGSMAVSLLSKR